MGAPCNRSCNGRAWSWATRPTGSRSNFGDLDTRSLRNSIVGSGKEPVVDSRMDPVPQSIASPALLFDELELKRADASKEKLPDYPPPALGAIE